MPEERKTLSVRRGRQPTEAELFAAAVQSLMLDPKFRRVMLTFLETSGMFRAASSPKSELLHWEEGRRALGFDMLRTLATHAAGGDHMVAMTMLLAERQPKEANNEHRSGTDYDVDRRAELGGPVDDERPEPARPVIRYEV